MCDFFNYIGFKASTTSVTGDNGIDILAKSGHNSIGIQTKLYYNHNVGNKAVQEVFSGKNFFQLNHAIVVTNSKFSQPAITLANQLKVGLIDRNTLNLMLTSSKKENRILIKNIIREIS